MTLPGMMMRSWNFAIIVLLVGNVQSASIII